MAIPAGYSRATCFFEGQGVPNGAAIGFAMDTSSFAGTLNDLGQLVADEITSLISNLTAQVAITSILLKLGPDSTGASGLWTGVVAGTYGTQSVPPNSSCLLSKQTALGGRAGRGRMYLPGIREDNVSQGGDIDGTLLGDIESSATAFLAGMAGADAGIMLEHGPDSPLSVPTPVIALTPQVKLATQRRRLRR